MFSFVGYEYHLDSALVRPTHERWLKLQDLILRLKSKRVLTARCLMSLIGLLASTEKMVPEGRLHMRPFQFHLKEHWRYPQSLDNLLPWTEAIVAHLDWWQNPSNVMKDADLHPKDHSIQLFTDASNEGWGAHLDQKSTKGLWSDREKRLHINVLELKAVSLALRDFKDQCQNQTVLVATDNSTVVAYINKQGGNSLRDVLSPVGNHDLVPSLPHNIESQAHSRVSECDGRPTVQVQPSAVNRMVSAPTGVQTDLPEVVHTSCRLICHSPEPQTPTVCVSYPIDALNIDWTNLTAYAYPPTALLHKVIQKIKQCHCLIIVIAPGWPGMPWFWDLVQLRDHTTTPSVNNPTKTVSQVCVPQQPTTAEPPRLVSRSGQLQEQGFSVEVAERIAAPQRSSTRTIYKSKWALFEKWCRENSVDFSTPSVKQISAFYVITLRRGRPREQLLLQNYKA